MPAIERQPVLHPPAQPPARTRDPALRAMVGIGTTILVVAALAIAQPVFAPLSCALFIIAIVWPLQATLAARLPKLLALTVSMLATILALGAFGWMISWGFGQASRSVIADSARFQQIYAQISNWLEGHGIVVATLWAEHFNVGWMLTIAQQITNRLNGLLSFSVIVLIYVMLGLMEADDCASRLRGMGNGMAGRMLLAGGARTAVKLRRYMLVRTLMSIMTGLLVWGFISLCGLKLAGEWGVIAFALNYIPFIGPLIATVMPTLFAMAEFDAWQNAILVFVSLNLIQFLVGSYLEPMVAGSMLSISPFLVLFAVFFWTYLWGMYGAFIGVPIVIAALTLCEEHPSSRWIGQIFGAGAQD